MRAAFVTAYGGPRVLEIRETAVPRLEPRQVLVKVRAFGLNFADIFSRLGVYPNNPKAPFIPGLECSGDIVAVGPEAQLFNGRERVMGYSRNGSHAEYVAIDERFVAHMPPSMTYEEGSAFLATYLSAYHGVVRLANLRKGEKLLVHAAAGGVGLATIQLANHIGAEIFGTAGTDAKVALARSQGAHHVINYVTQDFSAEILRITNGYGVDVVMDSVGGDVFRKSWHLLSQMGRYVLFGVSAVAGKGALSRLKAAKVFSFMKPIFPPSLMSVNKAIFGFNLGTLTGKEEYFREAVTALMGLYEQGTLKPQIGKVFRFDEIVEAHRFLQTRRSMGKVVVLVNG